MTRRFFSLAKWRAGIVAAFARFPFAILCGAVGAGCAVVGIHESRNDPLVGQCERLAMTVALGLPLFFSLRIIRERAVKFARFPLELLGVAFLGLWLFTHSARPSHEPGIVFLRWALVLAAMHFVAALAPYLWGREGPGFWQYNRRLFLRFCLATLYTFVLTVGLELALLSADKLFDLHLHHAYGDLYFLMVGCFHPTFFLAGVPRDFVALDSDEEHPRGLKAFTQFALAPLVLVYGAILYGYAVKILYLRSWPHGWVALPVLILSGVGIFASLLLHPLCNRPNERWASSFGRIFAPALAPLSILLLLSLRVRIADYGVTEERYIGVVASLWIFAWSLVFAIRRTAGIRWIPASLALIAIAIAYGPWSAGAVARRSQLARAIAILQTHGLWTGSEARPAAQTTELPHNEGASLRSTMEYLIHMHGAASVRSVFGNVVPNDKWPKLDYWNAGNAIMDALHLAVAEEKTWRYYNRKMNEAIDVTGFRRAWPLTSIYGGVDASWNPTKFDDLRIGFDHGVLKIAVGDAAAPEPLALDEVIARAPAMGRELSDENARIDFAIGGRAFRLVFQSFQLQERAGKPVVNNIQFLLLER